MAKKKTAGTDSTPAQAPAPATPARARRTPAKRAAAADRSSRPSDPIETGVPAEVGAANNDAPVASSAPAVDGGGPLAGPSHAEIAEAAYHRYLSRGGSHGADFDDWVEAERALRSGR